MDDKSKLLQLEVLMADMLIKQDAMEETLERHTGILNEHTGILNEQTDVLNEQTDVLNEHTEIFTQHTDILNQHSAQFTTLIGTVDRIEGHFKVAIDLFQQMREDIKELKDGILNDHETRLRTLESIVRKAS